MFLALRPTEPIVAISERKQSAERHAEKPKRWRMLSKDTRSDAIYPISACKPRVQIMGNSRRLALQIQIDWFDGC